MSQNSVKLAAGSTFDVFLSHNSTDKPRVREVADVLVARGLSVWFDERELIPGRPWQEALEEVIANVRSAAVLIGRDGLGPWEEPEMRACLSQVVRRKLPVIPVLLPGAPKEPSLPLFLEEFTWVDLRAGLSEEGLNRLVWGIRGEKPQRPAPIEPEPLSPAPVVDLRGIAPDVVVCFLHPDRWEKLQSLRRWCTNPHDPLFVGPAAHVTACRTLEEAVEKMRQRPEGSILLLDGFEPEGAQLDELLGSIEQVSRFEVIINAPEWEQFAAQRPSASALQLTHTVTGDDTLQETLRKSLLRVRTRQLASVRVLRTKADLAEFFALRYRVWADLGYLAPEKLSPQTPWEVDFTDRTSLPLGLFSKADGRLLAAARLVRAFGDENDASLIHLIEEMLLERQSSLLQANFRYPVAQKHPFDILGEMTRFQEYYRNLVLRGASKAEVSRVIVSPEWQKAGLGEVVVDTICSLARAHSIETLFLACHAKHASFYERCGFVAIPGVTGNQFLTYKVPCVAMERQLFRSNDSED